MSDEIVWQIINRELTTRLQSFQIGRAIANIQLQSSFAPSSLSRLTIDQWNYRDSPF